MATASALNIDTFFSLFNAFSTWPGILAFSICLPAVLTAELYQFWSTSDMNALFSPRQTPRTRSLVVTLTDMSTRVKKKRASANLLVISSATHASQLCALALPSVRTQDKHRGSAIWTHDRCALLVSTLEMHVPTPQARLPTLTPHPSASTTLTSIRALVDGVAFLDARPTRSAKPKMIRIEQS